MCVKSVRCTIQQEHSENNIEANINSRGMLSTSFFTNSQLQFNKE